MRRIACRIFIILYVIIFSMFSISCEAITAQNISNTGSAGMGENPGRKVRPDINGNAPANGGQGMNGAPGNGRPGGK